MQSPTTCIECPSKRCEVLISYLLTKMIIGGGGEHCNILEGHSRADQSNCPGPAITNIQIYFADNGANFIFPLSRHIEHRIISLQSGR